MKRRILSLLLPLALLLTVAAQAAGALLPRALVYEGQFADVSMESWYYPYVAASYEYGLINGRGDGFAPDAEITVAELLTLSARLHAADAGETIPAAEDGMWYAPYVAYLADRGLLPAPLSEYDGAATRAELAGIFSLSLPADCYDDRNDALVTDAYASGEFITDVDDGTPYADAILWLYRQGILAGMDADGSYWPDKTTTRAETAALLTRMVDPSLRVTPEWDVPPYRSAVGTTLASLIAAPDSAPEAPAFSDADAIDAAVRQMLVSGGHTMELRYSHNVTRSEAAALARIFSERVKRYCEQMYNTVECVCFFNSGRVSVSFSASGCADDTLAAYRDETMAKAIAVHDALWDDGTLHGGMSQYEIARVYFRWLCENCVYDAAADSVSHLAYSALLGGRAVCDGYTGAYNLFLKMEGIDCYAQHNAQHIWTVAELDGVEYHIDVTWGDPGDGIDWRYFGMTAEQSYREHAW